MNAGVKIKLDKDPATGELRVPPKVMELLLDLGAHKKICPDCENATKGIGNYCPIGLAFAEELSRQPEVEPFKD